MVADFDSNGWPQSGRKRALEVIRDANAIMVHGDLHFSNTIYRPGESFFLIDFDDMVMGPPVQDIWLLLPDHANRTRHQINQILTGYEQFMEFDDRSLRLVEILRAMRIIYFLSWCSTQIDDYRFQNNFPDWGSSTFWQREVADLEHQYQAILNDDRLK
jgi:Ser/Thr protein kinase RdoA (MazF antagonist)